MNATFADPLCDPAGVVVIGAGNAAFSAALSAREHGASVLMLEKAAPQEAHGNSRFTAGSTRFAYDGIDDLRALMPELTEAEIAVYLIVGEGCLRGEVESAARALGVERSVRAVQDAGLRARIGGAARERVKRHDIGAAVTQYVDALETIVRAY